MYIIQVADTAMSRHPLSVTFDGEDTVDLDRQGHSAKIT